MQDAFAYCEAQVRARDRDRFLSALFAPAQQRAALFALYAFNLEVARVREAALGLAGEIRLQWWADILAGQARGEVEGNPVAAALLAAIAQYGLDTARLAALIDAHRFDLYDEPMSTLADFEAYADAVTTNLIKSATQIVLGRPGSETEELAHHTGIAQAITGLLAAFPVHSGRGQLYLPLDLLNRHGVGREHIAEKRASPALRAALGELRSIARHHLRQARQLVGRAPAAALPAFLPVALAGPTLARMERKEYQPFAPIIVPPWRRQWLIWRAARRPERIFEG
ncbi:MAG TPA: phytoene/squalene synthase family protein [Xanthobacteraceae bacterium]